MAAPADVAPVRLFGGGETTGQAAMTTSDPSSDDLSRTPLAAGGRPSWPVMVAALALVAVVAAAVVAVFAYVDAERNRDLRAWQTRLRIVADSRFAAVGDWLDRQLGVVGGLAENASVQLYLGRLIAPGAADGGGEAPEFGYLRNLLIVRADGAGFTAPPLGPAVGANVARVGVAGLLLTDTDGRVLVATPGAPPLDEHLRAVIRAAPDGRVIDGLRLGPGGAPSLAVVAPIYAVQSNRGAADRIGFAVGLREVAAGLYPLLIQPGASGKSAEAVLLRADGRAIDYLSPLADGTPPLRLRLDRDTPDLVAAKLIDAPGRFAVGVDYRNLPVLAVGRRFAAVPWTLMYKIDSAEALAATETRLERLLTVLLLAVAAIAAGLVAVWRHGSSLKARAAAALAGALAEELEAQRDFLDLVTDSQPNAMALIDGDGRYLWANRKAAADAGLDPEAMAGKSLASVVGPVPARFLRHTLHEVLSQGETEIVTHAEERDGVTHTIQSTFVPLAATDELPERVLISAEDVTVAVEERARRVRLLDQLVDTLVGLVDRRDPHAANHSTRVALVARAIAEEMALDRATADCAVIAGRLMNIGKILVPESLLAKTEPLSDDERARIRGGVEAVAELLDGIDFPGPVVAVLRQLPQAMTAADVLPAARVVAVANAFVALVSPRAYRDAITADQAADRLLAELGDGPCRRVALALANYLDNRGGRGALAALAGSSAA